MENNYSLFVSNCHDMDVCWWWGWMRSDAGLVQSEFNDVLQWTKTRNQVSDDAMDRDSRRGMKTCHR